MINPEITEYVRKAQASGESSETIMASLKSAGWDEVSIAQAIEESKNPISQSLSTPAASPTQSDSKKRWLYIKAGLILLAVAVIIFGGLKSYSYFTSNPEKIWADTSAKMLNISSAHIIFDASYSEPAPADESDSGFGEFLGKDGKIKLSVSGKGTTVIHKDQNDVDYDLDSTIGVQLGSLNISFNFLSRKLGNFVYYKMDGNPLAGLFGGGSESGKPAEWLKIDINDSTNTQLSSLTEVQKNQILEAFKKAKLMRPTKLLGSEVIDNVPTWHYQAALDKQELKNYLAQIEKTLHNPDASTQEMNAVIDKIEFQKLELWIGKSDHLIHQAVIESNAPGLIAASVGSARDKSRDARRIADIKQLQVALELFYNDNGRYPAAVNGQPSATDGKYKFNTYISVFPAAPTPADGTCTDSNNAYHYEQVSAGKDYKLTFCLGHDTSSYKSGILEVTPNGIVTTVPSNQGTDVENILAGVPFSATIAVKLNLSQFNANVSIEPPQGEIQDVGASVRDAKRIADTRQLMTIFELYYNDFGKYPETLSQVVPKYIPVLPVAPSPDGTCSAADNNYSYQLTKGGQSYVFTFCLGTAIGGYPAGKHTSDPSGLK